jgi:hypothetical protein
MREIPLSQGFVALIDDADFELVGHFRWHMIQVQSGKRYAQRNIRLASGRKTTQLMHRVIVDYKLVDHINRNGLDNQRYNLRSASHSQNHANATKLKRSDSTSIYKGVYLNKNRWIARITLNQRLHYLGSFLTERDAALAYNEAARSVFGEFALLNEV